MVLDFYAVKCACAVAAKKERNTTILNLPAFFLQTEVQEEDEIIIAKFTRALVLLLVKYNRK